MKTLVLANQKGGVGKSAVATLLVHHLIQQGQRVLAVDLDHQGNLSKPLRRSGRLQVAQSTADMVLTGATWTLPDGPAVLLQSSGDLLVLERQPALHNHFALRFREFLAQVDERFDVCIVDTNPNPDIRVVSALVSADFVLSPIQLNQEALDGVAGLLNHPRVGLRRIKAMLNAKLVLIGLLPTMVEATPFQRDNFVQLIEQYSSLMIPLGEAPGNFAKLPRRTAIAEAQSEGAVLWEMKKTSAREAWRDIEPSVVHLGRVLTAAGGHHVA